VQAEDEKAKVKVILQLEENVKNNFDYCELQIPFGKRLISSLFGLYCLL